MNTVVIQTKKFPGVGLYFTFGVREPMGGTTGSGSFVIDYAYGSDTLTLADGITQINGMCEAGDSAMWVCHGLPNKLMISYGPGSQVAIDWGTLQLLNGWGDLVTLGHRNEFAKLLGIDTFELEMMLGDIGRIQKKRLKHVAIRACRIGNDPDFLREWANLFGCESVSAPLKRDFFACVRPTLVKAKELEKLQKRNPHWWLYGQAPDRFLFYADVAGAHGDIHAKIESTKAVDDFLKVKFALIAALPNYVEGQFFAVHGLWNDGKPPLFPTESAFAGAMKFYQNPNFRAAPPPPPATPEEAEQRRRKLFGRWRA